MLNKLLVEKPFLSDYDAEINFKDLSSIQEFWQFTETVLLDSLYDGSLIGQVGSKVKTENLLLGGVRMRQLRVRNDSCEIHEDFKHLFSECFDFYSSSSEDKGSFGLRVGAAWNFHSAKELDGFMTWGIFHSYHGGGFYQTFSKFREITREAIRSIRDNDWIDRGTRVVFIEFTIYNPNINVICSAKLTIEILPTGSLVSSTDFRVMKERSISTLTDYVWTLFAVAFFLQIAFYTYHEVREMIQHRLEYFKSFWNWIDISIIVIAYLATGFVIFRTVYIKEKIKKLEQMAVQEFVSFDLISFWHVMFIDALGVCIFLIWIRMLKFIKFNRTMLQFVKTLAKCARDVAGFGFMFLIVFVAYAQLGNVLFGSEIHDFRSFTDALFTLMRTILGDFDYLSIEKAHRVLGPIFFLSYIFFVFFVLLNMFLAIINDTYADVKSSDTHEVLPVGKFVKEKFKNFCKKSKTNVWNSKQNEEIEVAINQIGDVVDRTEDINFQEENHSNCLSCNINKEKFSR